MDRCVTSSAIAQAGQVSNGSGDGTGAAVIGKQRITGAAATLVKAVSADFRADRDPFTEMWSASNMEQLRPFDQNLLTTIYNKPNMQVRHQVALFGSGILCLLSMPFGPMGMAAGGIFGAVVGGLLGLCADRRRRRKRVEESMIQRKRLRSLVRWATERLSEDDEGTFRLIEMVTLEFKSAAMIADASPSARKQLKLLDAWVCERSVQRQLWAYMDHMLCKWQELSSKQFVRSMTVFQTLLTMYKHSSRALDEQEAQFVAHIHRLLEHPSVQSVMEHAQHLPGNGDNRALECMVYADRQRVKKTPVDPSTNSTDDGLVDAAHSDDSDNEGTDQPCSITIHGNSEEEPKPGPAPRQLKKPFFKSWDDFMEFDIDFKRKMPVTLSEFNLLLEKEQEPVTDKWELCVDRKEIRVAKMMVGAGCITLRAWATVPGVKRDVAFYLFHNQEERVKWDKVFNNMCSIGDPLNGSEVLYSLMRVSGVTPRDFLQYRRVRVLEDGSIVIVLRSAEHADCPETKAAIRAESYIAGYVIRQEYEAGQPVLKLFIMSCSDIKGLIPKWIINMVAPKKPAEWVDSLRKVCMDYQEAKPDAETFLQQYLAPYKAEEPWDYEAAASDFDEESPRGALLLPDTDSKLTL